MDARIEHGMSAQVSLSSLSWSQAMSLGATVIGSVGVQPPARSSVSQTSDIKSEQQVMMCPMHMQQVQQQVPHQAQRVMVPNSGICPIMLPSGMHTGPEQATRMLPCGTWVFVQHAPGNFSFPVSQGVQLPTLNPLILTTNSGSGQPGQQMMAKVPSVNSLVFPDSTAAAAAGQQYMMVALPRIASTNDLPGPPSAGATCFIMPAVPSAASLAVGAGGGNMSDVGSLETKRQISNR